MSTHATTRVKEGRKTYINLYRQMDGYPKMHGRELFEFLRGRYIVNGITDWENSYHSNGAGCLAASLVAHFKQGIGKFYILPELSQQEEWDYCIKVAAPGKPIWVEVRHGGNLEFKGTVSEFGEWLVLEREDDR